MDEKVYSMSEAAKLLNVSRQTIYNKIDRPDLQPHIQDTDKGKVLSEEGFQVLKSILSSQTSTVNGQSIPVNGSKYIDNLIDTMKAENEHLKQIVSDQSSQIANLTRIVENSQVLLKQEQERSQLLIEAAQAPQEAPRVFFSRVFKK